MIIKYFSWIREHVGKSEENFDLPSDITTINELIDHLNNLNDKYKHAFAKRSLIKIAINKTYSPIEAKISNNDEVAFFPPVTGG
jgi:sulfur-carrier protein